MDNNTTTTTTAKRGRPSTKSKEKNYEEIIKKQNDMIEELQRKFEALMSAKTVASEPRYNNIMDKPCTLIHLWECVPGLPTTIYVRDIPYQFTKFGEKKIFRYEDIQMIVSRYRDFFNRGVFTLGSDCDDMKDSLGIDFVDMPMSASKYNHIASMPQNEFESIVKSLSMSQKIILAKTWVNRFREGKSGYDDMQKVVFINRETDGFLDNFIDTEFRKI